MKMKSGSPRATPTEMAHPRWPRRYVVVADGGTARILHSSRAAGAAARTAAAAGRGTITLDEIVRLENPVAHLPARALVSDRTGRVFESSGRGGSGPVTHTRHGAQSDYDPHIVATRRFAKKIAQRLQTELRRGRVEELVLIAAPKFLGELRGQLAAPVQKLVTREVARDLVRAGDAHIVRAAFSPRRS